MNTEATVLIQYTWHQKPFIDNIRPGSGRIWKGNGDAIKIPAREKFSYLAHTQMFKEVSPEEYDAYLALAAEEAIAPFLQQLAGLPVASLEKIHAAVANAIAAAKGVPGKPASAASKPKAVKDATTAKDLQSTTDAGTHASHAERVQRIAGAIKEMDLREDTQGKDGWPIPDAVRDRCGLAPTEYELVDAMALLGFDTTGHGHDLTGSGESGAASGEGTSSGQQPTLKERAELALNEAPAADLKTLREMAAAFDLEFSQRQNTETLRKVVTEALTKLAQS